MEAVQLYLDSGMNVNVKNSYGRTPLISASAAEKESPWYNKNADMVKLLLKNGADVNAKDNDGLTALATAQKAERPAIVQLLKDAGAAQ
jgi:ankyrin repeat protein